jgi:hypothetical protein
MQAALPNWRCNRLNGAKSLALMHRTESVDYGVGHLGNHVGAGRFWKCSYAPVAWWCSAEQTTSGPTINEVCRS